MKSSESSQPEVSSNTENLREIDRTIASALIFSSDGYLLMGRKDPQRGGVYSDVWHIPGGGVDEGETLEEAVVREVKEEVGLTVDKEQLAAVPIVGAGATEKTVDDERVWCRMQFNRFEIHLDKTAAELENYTMPSDDLVELKWMSPTELETVPQIPGGREFFVEAGYIINAG